MMESESILYLTNEDFLKLSQSRMEQIIETVENMTSEINKDNSMYERYNKRVHGPEILPILMFVAQSSPTFSIRHKSQSSVAPNDHVRLLRADQKCVVAESEIEELQKDLETLQDECETSCRNYQARLTAMSISLKQARTQMTDFLEKFKPMLSKQYQRSEAHMVYMKWYNSQLKFKDNLVYRLRISNMILRSRLKRVVHQLTKVTHRISLILPNDLEGERIKCERGIERLAELNKRRDQLKAIAVRQNAMLERPKRSLELELEEARRLKMAYYEKSMKSTLINEKISHLQSEEALELDTKTYLQWQMETYKAPTTTQYMNLLLGCEKLSRKQATSAQKLKLAREILGKHKRLWSDVHGL